MTQRIGIGVECLRESRAGIARVGIDLFSALLAVDEKREYLLIADRQIPSGDVESIRDFIQCQPSVFYPKLPDSLAIPLWVQFQLPRLLRKLDIDLYLHTGTPPLLPFLPPWPHTKKILFLHDLINVKSPHFFNPMTFVHASLTKRLAVRSFDHILTNSVATKEDAIRVLQADPETITVVPLGLSMVFTKPPTKEAMARVRGIVGHDAPPFVLFVGTLEPRKNLEGLLSGFKLSGLEGNFRLVVVGAEGWKTSGLRQKVAELELGGSVIFTGYVSDDELCAFYRSATVFCYPSFDEGFGLPVLEAMACGCPVVASGVPAIKEVGGDVPIYLDPKSKRSIAWALKEAVQDKQALATIARRGKERAKRFSWDRAALEVSKVMENMEAS